MHQTNIQLMSIQYKEIWIKYWLSNYLSCSSSVSFLQKSNIHVYILSTVEKEENIGW